MAKKIYKTNKGKILDMEAMRQQNEKIIAAGNMSVNAKGDIVQGGKIIKTAKERVTPSYNKTTQIKQVGLKKPLTSEDIKIEPMTKPELSEMDTSEMTTETIKTRDDGSKYKEIMTSTGDIEIKELTDSVKKKTKNKIKKKAKAKPKRI